MAHDRVNPVDFVLALHRQLERPAGEDCCADGSCVLCRAQAESDARADASKRAARAEVRHG